ncbi:MAG TPA: alpha-amylase family glycosyl hydrolase, partial [Tepidisphaeraceae bacterium]|nr:alpha-amylase family glycosyl hydrolase [Tepidisphaeraceae bacterium]
MFQAFHWHTTGDGSFWRELGKLAPTLAERGFTSVWIPPSYKCAGGADDRGYGVYDLFDLGEFDQKNSVRTKYGTRDELLSAIKALQANNIHVYADVVFNHRLGGDNLEEVEIVEVGFENRVQTLSEPYTIRTWSHFSFPGRAKKYSSFEFHQPHFTAFDAREEPIDHIAIFRVAGK